MPAAPTRGRGVCGVKLSRHHGSPEQKQLKFKCPTEHFTILQHSNPSTDVSLRHIRGSKNFEALVLFGQETGARCKEYE